VINTFKLNENTRMYYGDLNCCKKEKLAIKAVELNRLNKNIVEVFI